MHTHGKAIGRWLGIFAIAMLFIGPPIGQWRAAAQQAASHGEGVARSGLTVADHAHAHASAHDPVAGTAAMVPATARDRHVSQVGVLAFDHCGYCHLVACFAALPGSLAALPLFDWGRAPALARVYQAPTAPVVSIQRARAPPLQRV